jgi:hypothetical protein
VLPAEPERVRVLLRRALSLLRPGEVQELCMYHSTSVSALIVDLLAQEDASPDSNKQLTRALESLRAVRSVDANDDMSSFLALIKRHAATITGIQFAFAYRNQLPQDACGEVSCCPRLEVVSIRGCPPAAWLGLSQLHTLHHVNLARVTFAAIAAALPRLHTLHIRHDYSAPFSVDVFFDDLLPRLQSFHYWPPQEGPLQPLPRLEYLQWQPRYECAVFGALMASPLPRGFLSARPLTVDFPVTDIEVWLSAAWPDVALVSESPLSRVRVLTVTGSLDTAHAVGGRIVAQALRVAPQLRRFTFSTYGSRCDVPPWYLSTAGVPGFTRLKHSQLRHLSLTGE